MRVELLDLLAEPETGAALRLVDAESKDNRIWSGTLESERSGRRYPIVRGIPRFVAADGYTTSFGKQWNRFRRTQVDSETGGSHSRERFDDEAGWTQEELAGKWCLDAGCGAGRFAEIAASRGANLVALDLSSAVDATAETCRRFPNVDIVQGSILSPPFRRASFDFVYSLGVVQHIPDPDAAIRSIVSLVKPTGGFALTIYARRPWSRLNAKYLVRPITKRVSQDALLKAIELTMPVMFPITDALYRVPVVGHIARFTIPVANWVERRGFTREQRYEEAVLDTLDALSPAFDLPMTWREVQRALEREGVSDWTFRNRHPIIVRGHR